MARKTQLQIKSRFPSGPIDFITLTITKIVTLMAGCITFDAMKRVYNQIAAKINDTVALCSGIVCPVCRTCPFM